jgi:hypothetical protein
MTNATSYFSKPADTLDPKLFQGRVLKASIRNGIMSLIKDFLNESYRHSEMWAHPWLAGSGVSYQWQAAREPGDLDCLIGIDFIRFKKANPEFSGLTNKEISDQLNEEFHDSLQKKTENWNGYELTFYALATDDIKTIKPYAAYDLLYDEWSVVPDPNAAPPSVPEWDEVAGIDETKTNNINTRFETALQDLRWATAMPARRNAEVRLDSAAAQGGALFDEIHNNRSQAFSDVGEGYSDFHNYRWQAGKRNGTVQKLKSMKKYLIDNSRTGARASYGVELPDADTLIRRAAIYRIK